jgi:G3E family GTPase
MNKPTPIPVTIITGFLGSGKTTLLNRILRDSKFKNTVTIINEFGAIGLDHQLIETIDENTVLLSSGCLCCTIRDDLISTFEDLLRKRDNNRIPPFDRILIETTGLADPTPILHTIMGHKYLSLRYRLEGIVTLVDCVNGLETLRQYPEAVKQAAVADRLIVSKRDLASLEQYNNLARELKVLNATAQLLNAQNITNLGSHILECGLYNPDNKLPDVRRWLNEEAINEILDNHEGHNHVTQTSEQPDINRHSNSIRAFCFSSLMPVSLQAYEVFIELLRAVHGANLLRVKGIVYLKDKPDQPLIVQGAQHVFHPVHFLESWPTAEKSTKLVFIVKDIPLDTIEKLWAALIAMK